MTFGLWCIADRAENDDHWHGHRHVGYVLMMLRFVGNAEIIEWQMLVTSLHANYWLSVQLFFIFTIYQIKIDSGWLNLYNIFLSIFLYLYLCILICICIHEFVSLKLEVHWRRGMWLPLMAFCCISNWEHFVAFLIESILSHLLNRVNYIGSHCNIKLLHT